MIDVEINRKDAARVENILRSMPGGAKKAYAAAARRALSYTKTQAFKEVKKVYAVKSGDLRSNTATRVQNPSAGQLTGFIHFSGVKIPLYQFNVKPSYPSGQKVRAGLMKGSWTLFEDAFIAQMNSGHIGIFERTGEQGIEARVRKYGKNKHTEKVEQIMGLSGAQMVGNEEIIEKLSKDTQEKLLERLDHEIERILNGYGGR